MSKLSELAAKVAASRVAREAKAADLATKADDLDKRANAALAQSEAALQAAEVEIQELESSLNADIGHNSPPA